MTSAQHDATPRSAYRLLLGVASRHSR